MSSNSVRVVRCKDCVVGKYHETATCQMRRILGDNGYCSMGIRWGTKKADDVNVYIDNGIDCEALEEDLLKALDIAPKELDHECE